jgi:hypothetical protein
MRHILIAGVLLAVAGCRTVDGPLTPQTPIRVDDPSYTIGEQQRWGRAKLALPDDSPAVLPPTGIPRPGAWGVPLH